MKTETAMKTISDWEIGIPFIVLPDRARTLRYTAPVTRALNERIVKDIDRLLTKDAEAEIGLFVTSPGGPSGTAMSFYDTVRHLLKPKLVTIGSGDVDSSGIIIFLSGTRRYVSERTTLLFHPAGRIFGGQRYTTREMQAMLEEDRLKDEQYAQVVADNSKLSREDVLAMMYEHTVLSPQEALRHGLADAIIP
jgi:ATP-dependent protease ClpP protease subunit